MFRKYNYLKKKFQLLRKLFFVGFQATLTFVVTNLLIWKLNLLFLSLSITNLKIPHSDFKSNIRQYVTNKCQSVWEKQTEKKLHELKPDFNSKCAFLGYSRQIQTKITRCRIGHTHIYSAMSSLHFVYPVINLSPLSIFSLLALTFIISAKNILPQTL